MTATASIEPPTREPMPPQPDRPAAVQPLRRMSVARARLIGGHWLSRARTLAVRIPLSGLGWFLLAGSALAWLAGVLLGWLELVTMAALGAVLLLLAIPFTLGRTSIESRLALTSRRVVAGERVAGEVVIRNRSERRQLPFDLELPVGDSAARFGVPSLPPGATHEELLIIPTERRGIIAVGPASAVRGDPLGLLRRGRPAGERQSIYVHPRTVRIGHFGGGSLRDLEGVESDVLSNSDLAFHALREYEPGDDRRHIHWRSSARINQLMVRQFADTRRSHVTLILSADASDYAGDDEYELAVSVVGSIGLQALRDEQRLTVRTAGQALPTSTAQRFLDGLAGISCVPAGGALLDNSRELGNDARTSSLLVAVSGSAHDAGQLRATARHLAGRRPSMVLRACLGQQPGYAVVGGVRTLTLGGLPDLRRLLRASS